MTGCGNGLEAAPNKTLLRRARRCSYPPIEREEVVALLFNVSDIAITLANIERLLEEDDGEEEADEGCLVAWARVRECHLCRDDCLAVVSSTDPDAYFRERGYALRVEQRNLDAELPRNAASRGASQWADVVALRDGRIIREAYGSGTSDPDARASALRRWWNEEERPAPPLPHRLP